MRRIKIATTPTAVQNDGQWSVIRFLTLENVSESEVHARMCIVYGTQNVITKSTVNHRIEKFKWYEWDEPRSGKLSKRKTQLGIPQASTNSLIDMKHASLGIAIMSKSKV